MAYLYNRGTLTEEVSAQVFTRERRRLQAKHLWMEVKLRWRVLADRMYTRAPTGKSKEELDALLFDRAAKRNHTNPYCMKKIHMGCCNQRSPSMVETMQRVDGTLQRSNCAIGLRLQESPEGYRIRKQKLNQKWMHLWSIVQKGGRLERALVDSYGGCYARHCGQTAYVGKCRASPSCRHYHRP